LWAGTSLESATHILKYHFNGPTASVASLSASSIIIHFTLHILNNDYLHPGCLPETGFVTKGCGSNLIPR